MCLVLHAHKRSLTQLVALQLVQSLLHSFLSWRPLALYPAGQTIVIVAVVVYALLSLLKLVWCRLTPQSHQHTTPNSSRYWLHGLTTLITFVTGQRLKHESESESESECMFHDDLYEAQ